MRLPHLFEFMDLIWVPKSLRLTLREILECGNAEPFRPYYQWVKSEILRESRDGGFQNIVELGAGTAPVTRLLAREANIGSFKLIPCDLNPDLDSYDALSKQYPGVVIPRMSPVDFSKLQNWPPETLLFLSATFHHIPPTARPGVLSSLKASARRIMIFEPLQNRLTSIIFVFFSLFPAVILPLWFLTRPGRLRRFFWCWTLVAPLMFWWDGIASCVRQWSERDWRHATDQTGLKIRSFDRKLFSYFLIIE